MIGICSSAMEMSIRCWHNRGDHVGDQIDEQKLRSNNTFPWYSRTLDSKRISCSFDVRFRVTFQ